MQPAKSFVSLCSTFVVLTRSCEFGVTHESPSFPSPMKKHLKFAEKLRLARNDKTQRHDKLLQTVTSKAAKDQLVFSVGLVALNSVGLTFPGILARRTKYKLGYQRLICGILTNSHEKGRIFIIYNTSDCNGRRSGQVWGGYRWPDTGSVLRFARKTMRNTR